ncbi:MAG: hypothetical protein CVU38_03925 [Chloroflexi bacterium HGW-Chloroflexi-1]|nr:MAG: hypothetical protein CVU38_03925 [Chloroflexi bacterium HGW-Chloroflexi-1]
MPTVSLDIPEAQMIAWVRQLSPRGKRTVLKTLIPQLDEFEALVDYGEQQMRDLCARRGLNWGQLTEDERQQLVDRLLHEA